MKTDPKLEKDGRVSLLSATIAPPGFWLPMASLCWRELLRFYRQKSRILGYLGSPLVFWLAVGSGFGSSFRPGDGGDVQSYLEYFLPGTIMLVVLFTSVFGMMTVIEDRKEGFLQSALVSPAPRSSLVAGKVLGTASLATLQGFFYLLLTPMLGIHPGLPALVLTAGVLFLMAFGLTNLGFSLAWRLDSTHGFHALVNLVFMPLWFMSGAIFPLSGAAPPVRRLMLVNPLTYILAALRRSLYLQSSTGVGEIPSLLPALMVTIGFAGLSLLVALWIVKAPWKA